MSKKACTEQSRSGFTLVELLVVITIITILATVGLTVYTKFIQNARDGKRQTDLGTIQSALEQYFADQLYYPMAATTCSNGELFFNTSCSFKNPSGTKTYINNTPVEPVASRLQYNYQPLPSGCDNNTATKCTNYCLYASMENKANTAPSGCAFPSGYNFGVTPP